MLKIIWVKLHEKQRGRIYPKWGTSLTIIKSTSTEPLLSKLAKYWRTQLPILMFQVQRKPMWEKSLILTHLSVADACVYVSIGRTNYPNNVWNISKLHIEATLHHIVWHHHRVKQNRLRTYLQLQNGHPWASVALQEEKKCTLSPHMLHSKSPLTQRFNPGSRRNAGGHIRSIISPHENEIPTWQSCNTFALNSKSSSNRQG